MHAPNSYELHLQARRWRSRQMHHLFGSLAGAAFRWLATRLGKRHEVRGTRKRVEVALGRLAIDRLVGRAGMQLHCTSGCLWITHDGDPKDVFLRAGQHCEARRGCRVLVQALETSTYCIE